MLLIVGSILCILTLSSNADADEIESTNYISNIYIKNNNTVEFSNGIWIIYNWITVANGTLLIENATIQMQADNSARINIQPEGHLLVYNSTFMDGVVGTKISNEGHVVFENSTFGRFPHEDRRREFRMFSGEASFVQCRIYGWTFIGGAKLTLRGCEIEANTAIYGGDFRVGIGWHFTTWYNFLVEDCTFRNSTDNPGMIVLHGDSMEIRKASILNCSFRWIHLANFIEDFLFHGVVLIEGNTYNDCEFGIVIENSGSPILVRDNHIVATTALAISINGMKGAIIDNNSIVASSIGVRIETSRFIVEIRDMTISSSSLAMRVDNASVHMVNSSIHGATNDFQVTNDGRIELLDCNHGYKVEQVPRGLLRANKTISIGSVRWDRGPNITKGPIVIEDAKDLYLGSLEVVNKSYLEVTYWIMDIKRNVTITEAFSRYLLADTAFHSSAFDPLNTSFMDIIIMDDWIPSVIITSHLDGSFYNTNPIVISGSIDERGSGIDYVLGKRGEGEWMEVNYSDIGDFQIIFELPSDGDYDIQFKAVDNTGLVGIIKIHVTVDSQIPFIDVLRPDHWVNTNEIILEARTEPGSTASVSWQTVEVTYYGHFAIILLLKDGANAIFLTVVDRAGNMNITVYNVEVDKTAPLVNVDSPSDGSAINQTSIKVEGVTEEHAIVHVNNWLAERDGSSFYHILSAPEGMLTINVQVIDRAGNIAMVNMSVLVDTTPPELGITDYNGSQRTQTTPYVLGGYLRDENVVILTINHDPIDVVNDHWLHQIDLKEGPNQVSIRGVDVAGNIVNRTMLVHLDTNPPEMLVKFIIGETVLRDPQVVHRTREINGSLVVTVNEPCDIIVNNNIVIHALPDIYNFEIDFNENRLNDIIVHAIDLTGNKAEMITYQIYVDTQGPPIVVSEPRLWSTVHHQEINISGLTEISAYLTVEGAPVPLGANGTFTVNIQLNEGWNRYELIAVDDVGNRSNLTVEVRYTPEPATGENPDGDLSILLIVLTTGFLIIGLIYLVLKERL